MLSTVDTIENAQSLLEDDLELDDINIAPLAPVDGDVILPSHNTVQQTVATLRT